MKSGHIACGPQAGRLAAAKKLLAVAAILLKKYRVIKNMPVPLADFGVLPNQKFEKEIEYWNGKKKSFFE
jgi:hypothetical protein